jgi:hypothetical protein
MTVQGSQSLYLDCQSNVDESAVFVTAAFGESTALAEPKLTCSGANENLVNNKRKPTKSLAALFG